MKKILFAIAILFSLIPFCGFTTNNHPKYIIKRGYGEYGEVMYNFDGKYIRRGYGEYGEVIYHIEIEEEDK